AGTIISLFAGSSNDFNMSVMASRPFATPTQYFASQYRANASSKFFNSFPSKYQPFRIVRVDASSSLSKKGVLINLRSKNEIIYWVQAGFVYSSRYDL